MSIINIYMVPLMNSFFKKFMIINNKNIEVKLTLPPLPPKCKQN